MDSFQRNKPAGHHGLIRGRFIALEKSPGIRPVGIGETWCRLLAKCLLRVMGQEAKAACWTEQVEGGVESGIEGAIHASRLQWTQHLQEEEWGFLLIDAQNAFNEENRTAMLWSVRHSWPGGAQFTFTCYGHWGTFVVRNTADGSGHFLHSKEGVTQEDPPCHDHIWHRGPPTHHRPARRDTDLVSPPWPCSS